MKAPLFALKARNWGRRTVARLFPRHTRIAQQSQLIEALNQLVVELTRHGDAMREVIVANDSSRARDVVDAYDEFIAEA